MPKNILSILLLIAATALLAACGSPEGKLTSLMEEAAGIAESNKDNCDDMAKDLKEFAEDNKDSIKELKEELKKTAEASKDVCKDMKSDGCEDKMKEGWEKSDVMAKAIVASGKFRYYSNAFCGEKEASKVAREIRGSLDF